MIKSIKFPAVWWDEAGRIQRREVVEFKLGEGPCGKTVADLYAHVADNCLHIHQRHDDGTSKDFTYQLRDIPGRIEMDGVDV